MFISIVALMLLSSIGDVLADIAIPSYEREKSSYLEGRSYEPLPDIENGAFFDGSFQAGFESYLSDAIPNRDFTMLANAKVQRTAIVASSLLFGFDSYPTFYGSDFGYSTTWNSIFPIPQKSTDEQKASLAKSASVVSSFIDRHPDIRWTQFVVDRSNVSLASPGYELVSNPFDYQIVLDNYLSKMPEACTTISQMHIDTAEYYEKFFSTDHHWTIVGAYEAYSSISDSLGISSIEATVFEGYEGPFYGSEDRQALSLEASDSLQDVKYARSPLRVVVDGVERDESFLCKALNSDGEPYNKTRLLENVYASYFHYDFAVIEITNEQAPSEETLLIIGDSFTNSFERLFAEHYHTVYVIDPRYSESLDSFLVDHQIDEGIFIWSHNTFLNKNVLRTFK